MFIYFSNKFVTYIVLKCYIIEFLGELLILQGIKLWIEDAVAQGNWRWQCYATLWVPLVPMLHNMFFGIVIILPKEYTDSS